MNLTKNKWYLTFGSVLLLAGVFLIAKAFAAKGQPVGSIPWLKLGPLGLMGFIGGVAFLFLPANIKLK